MRLRHGFLVFFSAALLVAYGCGSSAEVTDPVAPAGTATPDAEVPTPPVDGAAPPVDGSTAFDAGVEPPDPATFHDLTDVKRWEKADGTLTGGPRGGQLGGAFDGRYVYALPVGTNFIDNPVDVYRFDSKAATTLDTSASWTKFDISQVQPGIGFNGAVFDGKYLYFVPSYGLQKPSGMTLRYDTTAPFDQLTSWKKFDLPAVDPGGRGYQGGTFDGRYVYYAPNFDGDPHGHAMRFDTKGDFTSAASWKVFDMRTLPTPAAGCVGAVFDGRYVSFIANHDGVAAKTRLVRFDTTAASFTTTAAWSSVDIPNVPAGSAYEGATFDGRYVYLVPFKLTAPAVRVDPQLPLSNPTAFTTFSLGFMTGIDSLMSGIYDGRYVNFLPRGFVAPSAKLVRYDTRAPFGVASSWASFGVSTIDANVKGLAGGAFDGRWLYLVPNADRMTLRFDVKDPPRMPKAYAGSFL